jgi:hypothetical protein
MPARNNRGIVTIRDVTRTAVAMEQLSKQVSEEMNTRNNRGAVFSMRSVPRGYKEAKKAVLSQLSFETPACQAMSLGTKELNWQFEASQFFSAVQFSWQPGYEEKTLYVLYYSDIWSVWFSETVIAPVVKIRCQEADSGDCNRLRTLVDVTVNCRVWKSEISLCYL